MKKYTEEQMVEFGEFVDEYFNNDEGRPDTSIRAMLREWEAEHYANTMLAVTKPIQPNNKKDGEVAIAFAEYCNQYNFVTLVGENKKMWRKEISNGYYTTKELYAEFQKAKATDR